ncbi:hypothetical protein BJV78DRAFT_1216248 [Lactifluus subvellereus]|nr:hypothetical protein BJV78DRAFT_1270144 [Lactifluus subvellereus]KAI0250897.1 hypothetical protein BJV78DRAFT_1216248 [Lactifluus subvellereus]
MAQICNQFSSFPSIIEELDIHVSYIFDRESTWQVDMEGTQWLDLFRPFTAIWRLRISRPRRCYLRWTDLTQRSISHLDLTGKLSSHSSLRVSILITLSLSAAGKGPKGQNPEGLTGNGQNRTGQSQNVLLVRVKGYRQVLFIPTIISVVYLLRVTPTYTCCFRARRHTPPSPL